MKIEPPLVVLDTNVVFDWLVFADSSCAPLRDAIERRQLRWIATVPMRDECFHVIERGALDAWTPNADSVKAVWAEHCCIVAPPPDGALHRVPRCDDTDDQMFIDLCVAHRVRWLFSRDRAVLRLAAPLARFGVAPVSPTQWHRQATHADGSAPVSRESELPRKC